MKKGEKASILMALLMMGLNTQAFAQEDPLLSETDNIVSTDEIDIEGLYSQKKAAPSAADRIQKLRRDLEQKHEQMMRKKVEDMRLDEERKLARKLQKALNGQMKAMDTVNTVAAAPVVKAPAPVKLEQEQKDSSFKLSGGFMNLSTEINSLDASANLGLAFESNVTPRVAVGAGVRYVSVKMTDGTYDNTSYSYNVDDDNEIKYRQISFDLYGKLFLTNSSKMKPFVGAGLAYNRGKFSADSNGQYYAQSGYGYYSNSNYNNNEDISISNNNVAAKVFAGAEVALGNMFAAELSVGYERALTSGISDTNTTNNAYEQTVRDIAKDVENANVTSVNAGLIFKF